MNLKSLGLIPKLVIGIIVGILIGSFGGILPVRILATFNGLFGNFLGFVIPLIIIGFVAPGIGELEAGAGKLLGMTAGIAYSSTVAAGLLAFFVNSALFPLFLTPGSIMLDDPGNPEHALLPSLFNVDMPPLMGVMTALLLAFTLGLGMAAIRSGALQRGFKEFQQIIEKLIKGIIIPLLPFHIAGIFANMTHAGQVAEILSVFLRVFLIIIALHVSVLIAQYFTAGLIGAKNPIRLLRTMIPAYLTALGTQSSAATIPVTLEQTVRNGVRRSVANFVVPLCATIHMSGSTITITSCAMAIMVLNGISFSFPMMIGFIMMLGITMVAAPGVPGGSVMAALGLLQTMLGFDQTLLSLMIALYVAQDSFGTACNVTGDGAIAVVVNRVYGELAEEGQRQEEA
jgi:Na+/H+-dicarboxylate symporter